MLVPGSIFPTWRHGLYICMFPEAVVLFSPDLFMCRFIRKSENYKMCSVWIPQKIPLAFAWKKRGRRLLGGVWAGYLDLVWCWLSKNAGSLGLLVGSRLTSRPSHRTNEEAKAERGHKYVPKKKLINTFLTTLPVKSTYAS